MKKLVLIKAFLLFVVLSFAQDRLDLRGFIAYAEVGGAAWQYSANIEYSFLYTKNLTFNARAGFGIGTVNSDEKRTCIGIPIGINVFTGQGNHHPELGLNISYVQGRGDEGDPSKEVYLVPSIGYRFQRPQGGFFAKFLWTPLIKTKLADDEPSESAYSWVGLSAGYFFARKH